MPTDVLALVLMLEVLNSFMRVWEAVMPMIVALLITLVVMLASTLIVKVVFQVK